jgi:hypothetical protein
MDYLYLAGRLFGAACTTVTFAAGVCAITPTPDPNTRLGKIYRLIEFLGLVVGKAKDTGLIKDQR